MRIVTAREHAELMSPWRHAYDIQSPAPGQPMQTVRGPKNPSLDPGNDPMGNLNERPYDYNTMVGNLVSHYQGANDKERKQGRLWYKAAHDMFHNFAQDHGVSPVKAVGYGAAFSPLTDWGDNVHHAQQFHFGYDPNGNPDHNEHNWQMAHIAQEPLDAFRAQNGRDPSDSDEDLHQLADLHQGKWGASQADLKKGLPGKNDIANNPDARQNWIGNIQHHGIGTVLEDQARQADAWNKDKKKQGPYNPAASMRDAGINTLGGNIRKAKQIYHSPDDVASQFKVLGGPKISHFYDNILDDTPISEDGYYQHPNGDWKQNKDLGGTIDSHHMRAAGMAHGDWERKPYAVKNPSTDHEYDVYNRGLYDATNHINSQEPDATKHITPKQLQATVWLKHKNDKDFFERQRNPATGQLINHESELGGVGRPEGHEFTPKSYKSRGQTPMTAALTPDDFRKMPPLWRKMFMSRRPQEWTELLEDYADHHSPEPEEGPDPHMAAYIPLAVTHDYIPDPSRSWSAHPDDRMRIREEAPYQEAPGFNQHDSDPSYFLQGDDGRPFSDHESFQIPEHLRPEHRTSSRWFVADEFDDLMHGQSFGHQLPAGPHENPWQGADADELRSTCPYCQAGPGEEHDIRCPTNHTDSPREWAQDTKAIGPGGHFNPGPEHDPMHRLNHVLAFSQSVLDDGNDDLWLL